MDHQAIISSENLEVTIRLPGAQPASERFDCAAVAEQVVLNGKHHFCVPEQLLPERVTCYGTGLCGEFIWRGLAEDTLPGEQFPKLGIGLLTQRPEGGEHSVWKHYEIEPFETEYRLEKDRATFIQQPKPCKGIAVRSYKKLYAYKNTLTLYTTLENVGERTLSLVEYQHNFLCIDGKRIGAGYRLELPFDGTIDGFANSVKTMRPGEKSQPLNGVIHVEGQTAVWDQDMELRTFFKETEATQILPMAHYWWKLSHTESPASVSESTSFTPARLATWGIEHCICAEVFVPISIEPGKCQSWSRTWIFED